MIDELATQAQYRATAKKVAKALRLLEWPGPDPLQGVKPFSPLAERRQQSWVSPNGTNAVGPSPKGCHPHLRNCVKGYPA